MGVERFDLQKSLEQVICHIAIFLQTVNNKQSRMI